MRYEWSNWKSIRFCINCDTELNNEQRGYSNGVCPHCGHQTKGAFCETYKRAVRYKYKVTRKWFMPFIENRTLVETEIKD